MGSAVPALMPTREADKTDAYTTHDRTTHSPHGALTGLVTRRGGVVHAFEGEAGVAGERKAVHAQSLQPLLGLDVTGGWAARCGRNLGQAVGDEQDEVDECTVGGACNENCVSTVIRRVMRALCARAVAGGDAPLISKLRNRQLARNRSSASSMISGWLGSAAACQQMYTAQGARRA